MGAKKSPKSTRDGRKAIAQARSDGRRSGLLWLAAGVVAAAALGVVVIVPIVNSSGPRTSEPEAASLNHPPATVAVGEDSAPPWPAPADAKAAVAAAGLPMMASEGSVEHIHAHLDVLADGRAVPVPANIGVDRKRGTMSALHTHDDSGVIHVEAPAKRQFSLGEFFSEWQVSLSADNIGALRADDGKRLRVFVNGTLQTGNPAAILFNAHDEVAVVYGTPQPSETIPSKYEFAEGE
jgi:hypothetical protein